MASAKNATDRDPMNPRDFHILLVIAARPLHGYAIVKEIERQSNGRLRMDPANLYRTLAALREDGLIRQVEPPEEPDDDRKRRYYRLTERGEGALLAEADRMRALAELADARMRARPDNPR